MPEPDAVQGRTRLVTGQAPINQPRPQGSVVIDDVRPEVGGIRAGRLRARPPRMWCASSRRTSAPPSAHEMLATSPAKPPPTTVILPMSASSTSGPSPDRGREPFKGSRPLEDVEDVVRAAQHGDATAMVTLMRELTPLVGRVCGAIALDEGDDAMQETMIVVLGNIGSLREPRAVYRWTRQVAVREALRVVRPRRPVDAGRPPRRAAGHRLRSRRLLDIVAILRRLTPDQRAILVLRDLEGIPEAEAAGMLGVEVGTVKSTLHRARPAFRRGGTDDVARGQPDRVRQLRVLGAALPGVAVVERVLDAPFDEVWSFLSDLERSVPMFDHLVGSLRVKTGRTTDSRSWPGFPSFTPEPVSMSSCMTAGAGCSRGPISWEWRRSRTASKRATPTSKACRSVAPGRSSRF